MLPTAQVAVLPPETWASVTLARAPVTVTATGTLLVVVELFPSWPPLSRPQQ